MKIQLEPVRGMRDILPPDSDEIMWLQQKFSEVAQSYGYRPVIAPTIELFKLFEVKSGPEISRSMYVFKDKAGREVCLRPEFTAGVARIYLRHLTPEPKPIKLYYIGSAYRYEEPQQGRYREFIQAGVEFIGDKSIYSDIELLLTIREYYATVGLEEYSVKMNTMALYRKLFSKWGIQEETQDEIIHYMDKKMLDKALDILKTYEKADTSLIKQLSEFTTNDPEKLKSFARELRLDQDVISDIDRLAEILQVALRTGVKNPYVETGFARGLAYYTGFIFEIKTPYLAFSIGGGGRYDTLISLYGGSETSATGYALGIDRLHLALKKSGWSIPETKVRILAIAMVSDFVFIDKATTPLRSRGYVVDVRCKQRVSELLSYAAKKNYDYVMIIGKKEVEQGIVTVKNLRTRQQKQLKLEELKEVELP